MSYTINGLYHRKLQSTITNDSHNLTSANNDDVFNWCTTLTFVAHLLAYIATLAVITIVLILIIMKLLGGFEEDANNDELGARETNPLLREEKRVLVTSNYGTISEEDGNCSTSSSEELYDGKLCVICYDEQRDCFFVPCGHCATCYLCAKRIFYNESKTCPVCRRLIGKVRRLFPA